MAIKSQLLSTMAITATLAGCIAVPVNPDGSLYQGPIVPATTIAVPPAPQSLALQVRLYPTNQAAAATGVLAGTVINQLNGKGAFTLDVAGEPMAGEATRTGGPGGRTGVASAYGAKGAFANCAYTMNSTSQGSGRCTFSNGAVYQLHIGG